MRLDAAACAAVVLCAATHANAQAVRLQTDASANKVELGQSFTVQLTAMGDGTSGDPSSPRLKVPAGVAAQGPSISTRQHITVVNGQMQRRTGFTAVWTVTPRRLGKLTIGPASVLVDGQLVDGQSVRVEVVPAGTVGQQHPGADPFQQDPFDLFRRRQRLRFPGLFGDPDPSLDDPSALPPAPPEYQMDSAPDPFAFLRVVPSKREVVAGEQVTLSVYAYGSRGHFRETNAKEPKATDFLSYAIVENSFEQPVQLVPIGDDVWHAVKVRELALFPLRAGHLGTGGMEMGFSGRGYAVSGQRYLVRESETITINVIEPPLTGRPTGYRTGDVGRYELSADVTPRQAAAGDAISVSVKLEGTGNLPAKLLLPESKHVEWLEPSLKSEIGPRSDGLIGGTRRFQYVVRLKSAGDIDLGEIRLPYYDPGNGRYATARVALGYVKVAPGDTDAAETRTTAESKLDGLLEPRPAFGKPAEPRTYWTDNLAYWLVLGGAPLGIGLLQLGALGASRLTRRLRQRRGSSESKAQRALVEAEHAARRGELAETMAAVERALFAAIEASLGLKARGFLLSDLAERLIEADLDPEPAKQIQALLEDCQTARFQQSSSGGAPNEYVARAKPLLQGLSRVKPRQRASTSEAP